MELAIDPGHNAPPDTGAVFGEFREDFIVLEVAKRLQKICEDKGVATVWCLPSKASSVGDSLRQRVNKSNQEKATIYCSIHANQAGEATNSARGVEVFAISSPGRAVAERVLNRLVSLGFKNRGVKTLLPSGYPPFVVANTNATAVLVELFFLDSKEDTDLYQKIGAQKIAEELYKGLVEPNNPRSAESESSDPSQLQSSSSVVKKDIYTVLDAIYSGKNSTDTIKGLSDRVISKTSKGGLVKLTRKNFIPAVTCDPFFQPHVAAALLSVLEDNSSLEMKVNSAYRSCVRQGMLWQFYRRGMAGITLAARVGLSNHEQGCAIDIENWEIWKPILIDAGWRWQGSKDPMHFELPPRDNIASKSIQAFQEIYNEIFPKDKLVVDGKWGPSSEAAFLKCPANGGIEANSEQKPYYRTLRLGDKGDDVYSLAYRLRERGFYARPIETKNFDNSIHDALIRYQSSVGLAADGIAGLSTLRSLFPEQTGNFSKFLYV